MKRRKETAFESAVATILATSNLEERVRWSNALRDSLNIRSDLARPLGPKELSKLYAVSISELAKRSIVMDTVEASELIKAISPGHDELKVVSRAFNSKQYERLFARPLSIENGQAFVTYAELFKAVELPTPTYMRFKELSSDSLPELTVWIDKGSAPDDKISELLSKISTFYEMCGGSGINFEVVEVRSFQRETA